MILVVGLTFILKSASDFLPCSHQVDIQDMFT